MKAEPKETIGECELCGRIDHHLKKGVCDACVAKYGDMEINALGEEADTRHVDNGRKDRLVALDAKFRSPSR